MSTMDGMSAARRWVTMLARLALNSCTGTCCLALQHSVHAGKLYCDRASGRQDPEAFMQVALQEVLSVVNLTHVKSLKTVCLFEAVHYLNVKLCGLLKMSCMVQGGSLLQNSQFTKDSIGKAHLCLSGSAASFAPQNRVTSLTLGWSAGNTVSCRCLAHREL